MAPRTRAGLEAVFSGRAEVLEHGLTEIASRIELPEVGSVSMLARDAAGAPVLVFVHDGAVVAAAVQALQVHAHLAARPWLLQRLFEHRLPPDAAPNLRVLLAGPPVDPSALPALARLMLPDLSVCEIHEWSVAGAREQAVRAVLVHPPRDDAGFSPPSGVPAHLRDLAREVMGWLERLDDDVVVHGDRFARVVKARGRPLCTLAVAGKELVLELAGGERCPLPTREAAAAAVDRVLTWFAAAMVPAAQRSEPAEPVPEIDFDDLRRSVADVRLTAAEAAALQLGEGVS